MKQIKRGVRYLNHLGEYCVIKTVHKNGLIKVQICSEDKPREETWKKEDFLKQKDKFWIVSFPSINRTNVARHILEYQLNMIGKTTIHTKSEPDWFNKWTIYESDYQLLKSYSISLLKKTFKFNSTKAKETFDWWYMHFGLKRVKDIKK